MLVAYMKRIKRKVTDLRKIMKSTISNINKNLDVEQEKQLQY